MQTFAHTKLLLWISVLLHFLTTLRAQCPSNFALIGDTCVYMTSSQQSYEGAFSDCESLGGKLASTPSSWTNLEVFKFLFTYAPNYYYLGPKWDAQKSCFEVKNHKRCYTSDAVEYWSENQPAFSAGADCILLTKDNDYDAMMYDCNQGISSLCFKEDEEYDCNDMSQGFRMLQDICLYVDTPSKSYATAKDRCDGWDSSLAAYFMSDDHNEVRRALLGIVVPGPLGFLSDVYLAEDGVWKDSLGNEVASDEWMEGEPSGGELCSVLSANIKLKKLELVAISCNITSGYMCLTSETTTAAPTTTTEESTTSTTTESSSTTSTTTTTIESTTEETTSSTLPPTTDEITSTTEEPSTSTTESTTTTEIDSTTETTTELVTSTPTETTTIVDTTSTTTDIITSEPTSTTTEQPKTTTEQPKTTTTEEITTTKPTTTITEPTTSTTELPTTTTESTTTSEPSTSTTTEIPTTTTTEITTTTATTTTTEDTTTSTTTEPSTTSTTTTTTEIPTTTTTTTSTTTTTEPSTTTATTDSQTTSTDATTTTSTEPTTTTVSTTTEELTTTTTTTTVEEPTTTTVEEPITTTPAKTATTSTTKKPTTSALVTTTTTTTTTTTAVPTTTTTAKPTTTTTMLPTTPGPRTGRFYNETGDYYYPNMVLNATSAIPGTEIKVTNGPIGFGWGVNLNSDPPTCLVFRNFPKNGVDLLCWSNPGNCEKGFSVSIWAKVTFLRTDEVDKYIFSTGGTESGTPGVAISYCGIFVSCVVSTGDQVWSVLAPGPVINDTWNEIGIRWRRDAGLEMLINGKFVAYVQFPDKPASAQKAQDPLEMTVGCRRNKDGTYDGFVNGEFDELTGWMWALEPEQMHFFTGGYDDTATCDPQIDALHCETNPEKIAEMMDNVVFESTESLMEALDHLNKVFQVQKDPAGSAAQSDGATKTNSDLQCFASTLEKVISKTSADSSELTIAQLKNLLEMQNVASNLLGEQYADGWNIMQNKGKSSVELMKSVEEWMLKKTSQTNIDREALAIPQDTGNIASITQTSSLYSLLSSGDSLQFPAKDSKRKKRSTENANSEEMSKIEMSTKMFGVREKTDQVSIQISKYKNLDKMSPLWNKVTGNDTELVFLDSEVLSANTIPEVSSTAMEAEPAKVYFKHRRKEKASGRRLLAEDLKETGEIRLRECVRWDKDLEIKGTNKKGGWSTDGCSMRNSTAEETVCECTQTGTYAILAKVRHPFDIPPEEEWLKLCKLICFGISGILLLFYILVILFKTYLHEQFHLIRLNLAGAALGASISFCLSSYMYEDENICRILSMLIHFFYTAVGCWLTAEAHAIFSTLVNGSIGNKFACYILIGWIIPGCLLGGCITLFTNYGYDYRCLVGPTAGMRWLLVSPILISTSVAFTFCILTCINYGTPALKKTAIVNELSSATRWSFVVVILFLFTWIFGIFALVDLGFDKGDIPAFNPIFQVLNSCLGIFIVTLIGFGSRHFRYSLCHSNRSHTRTKKFEMDPFEFHDNAKVQSVKKIYAS